MVLLINEVEAEIERLTEKYELLEARYNIVAHMHAGYRSVAIQSRKALKAAEKERDVLREILFKLENA